MKKRVGANGSRKAGKQRWKNIVMAIGSIDLMGMARIGKGAESLREEGKEIEESEGSLGKGGLRKKGRLEDR